MRRAASQRAAAPGAAPGAAPPHNDEPAPRPSRHRVSRALAAVVVALRWLVVPAWVAAAFFASQRLPSLDEVGASSSFSDVIPTDLPAIDAERFAIERFGFPVISRIAIVVRNADGISARDQAFLVQKAAQVDLHELPAYPELLGAIPVVNTAGIFPGSRERGTTGLLYLFFSPSASATHQTEVANRFVHQELAPLGSQVVGVTGSIPARVEQGRQITDRLPLVEAGTIVLVALAMAVAFRSVGAPIVALATAGLGYVLSVRTLGWLAHRGYVSTPGELEPLIVVLLVGVITDYTIFYLSAFRGALRAGAGPARAARQSAASTTPIVAAAAFLVASGTAALAVAKLSLFGSLGPGMAVTVLIALVLAATFVPAALGIMGRFAIWPGAHRAGGPGEAGEAVGWRRKVSRVAVHRAVAAVIVVVGVAGLVVAAFPARRLSLGVDLVGGLPSGAEARRAAQAAERGFAPGVIAPAELVVGAPGVGDDTAALDRLQAELAAQPGVAGVLGPSQLPLPRGIGLLRSSSGDAARYVIILGEDPYGASAIHHITALRQRLPDLLQGAGLAGAAAELAGDSALGASLAHVVWGDAVRIGLVTVAIDLVLLALFLRSVLLPFVVVALSGLVLVTALGLTSWVFEEVGGVDGLTFYVPVAVGVLLVTFGSDYNVFVIGRIWERAEHQPFRDAIVDGGTEASRAVAAAGVILAVSFALLAVIPLNAFRQFALAMVAGVMIDTFVVRSFVVPAVLALFGRLSTWPGRPRGS